MFKGHCFPKAIILQAVYYKLRFSLSIYLSCQNNVNFNPFIYKCYNEFKVVLYRLEPDHCFEGRCSIQLNYRFY